ncbi:unnamed protein product [Lathyrus sativus]|nr:unnamed protein product [Lathyrus sativus]
MVFHLYHCNDSPNPSPQQQPSNQTDHYINNIHTLHMALIAIACFVTMVMVLLTFTMFLRRHNHEVNRDRRNMPILFDVHGYRDSPTSDNVNYDDDDDERILDHPVWFIRTIGLQQSVIDSITVLKYRKNEGVVDGTECSVCLGEFQENESLRILPKCGHAFHIRCIDTWLRSHQNCPLCRAPVIDAAAAEVSVPVTVTDSDQVGSNVSPESLNQGEIQNFDNVGEFQVVRIDNDDDRDSVGVSSSERSYKNNTA